MEADVRRLWPTSDLRPLSDDELADTYPTQNGHRLLRVNCIASADGSATLGGLSGPLGDPTDQQMAGVLRINCDAIFIGAGTVRTEGYGPMVLDEPLRRMRLARGRVTPDPILALVTRHMTLSPEHPIFARAPQRPVVVTTEETAARVGDRFTGVADVLGFGIGEVDLTAAVAGLAAHGLPHLLCEGGPHLLGSLIQADLVDEMCLTLAPKLVGPGPGRIVAGPSSLVRSLALNHVLAAGDELFLHYVRSWRKSPR